VVAPLDWRIVLMFRVECGLLKERRMARLAPVVLAAALGSGCLYIGDINAPPRAELVQIDAPSPILRGSVLTFVAHLTDDKDQGLLAPQWTFSEIPSGLPLAACDFRQAPSIGSDGPRNQITFLRAGTFLVAISAADTMGATSDTAAVMVTVAEAPPAFVDPEAAVQPFGVSTNGCNAYAEGEVIPLIVHSDIDDPDAEVTGCDTTPEAITVRWTIDSLPTGSNAAIYPSTSGQCGACPPAPPNPVTELDTDTKTPYWGTACLCPDLGGMPQALNYPVSVYVSDGKHAPIKAQTFTAAVAADSPPCVDGAYPLPASYVVDRSEPWWAQLSPILDDRDGGPAGQVRWSLWRSSDPTWRVAPISGLSYAPDLVDLPVGETVKVRAEAVDRLGPRGACDADNDQCLVQSCSAKSGTTCEAWVTWQLELR
jgi:hypothetical protein